MKHLIVIGGGASGLMAAGQAALGGADVLLLEKMRQPGRKIIISGQGRCNITNNSELHEFISHFNQNGRFLHQAFARFFVPQLMDFFQGLGLALSTERGGRVFPASGRAQDVLDTLLRWLNTTGARLHTAQTVIGLEIKKGAVIGVHCDGKLLPCDGVILATGGSSYPATGSSGDGFAFARQAGHTITALRPALVPLETSDPLLHTMAGLDLRNIGVRIFVDGNRRKADFGEVGFTRFGIGGPVILTHSRAVVEWLQSGKAVTIALDLKPALDEAKLDARLLRDFQNRSKEELQSVLRGLLPQQLVAVCLQQLGLAGQRAAGETSAKDRARLRGWLKDFRIEISGHRPIREAIVTAGGVQVKEVNPRTMESCLVRGLYFCGEILDVDGETGGYNLQAAFSTGWLAGRSAAHQAATDTDGSEHP